VSTLPLLGILQLGSNRSCLYCVLRKIQHNYTSFNFWWYSLAVPAIYTDLLDAFYPEAGVGSRKRNKRQRNDFADVREMQKELLRDDGRSMSLFTRAVFDHV